jgi:hypothetical protein
MQKSEIQTASLNKALLNVNFTFIALIALKMEAASTSETSVNFYQTTWRNNPEDSHIQTVSYSERLCQL